jgi:hypothetical protein
MKHDGIVGNRLRLALTFSLEDNAMDDERAQELAGLRELALRLLPSVGYVVSADSRPEFVAGQIPADLRIPLPLPTDAHIVGSVVSARRTDIFFDTNEPLEELQRLYAGHMASIGWQNMNESAQSSGPGRGGFVHYRRREADAPNRSAGTSAIRHLHEVFFDEDSVTSLTIMAAQPEGQLVPVQMTFQTYARPEQAPWRHRAHNIFRMLPPLTSPEGSSQRSGGGSAGATEVWNFATLITDLDVKAVGDHYNAQLIEGGWTLLETGYVVNDGADGGKRAAWSYWRFTDEENRTWYGSFAVLSHPETPRDYSLVVQARRPADPASDSVTVVGALGVSSLYFGPAKSDS